MWYTAGTYDLPLNVFFLPNSDNCLFGPEVEIDFTCTPGVYADPELERVISSVSAWDITLPVEFMCSRVIRDGKYAYDLNIDKMYRDQLAECGITYNVQAFVKVTFPEGGKVSLNPDTLFTSCLENSDYIHLGDTLIISPNNTDRSFIFAYADWQNDSIRFVWEGDGDAEIFIATTECQFIPERTNPYVLEYFTTTKENPYKLQSEQIKDIIKKYDDGGLFYGKIISNTPGKFVVEKIPLKEAGDNVILLEHEKTVQLAANDTNKVFCFPRTWKATEFLLNNNSPTQMYIAKSKDFILSKQDAQVLSVLDFRNEDGQRLLHLSKAEMNKMFASTTEDYLYVRFVSESANQLTPVLWQTSDCAANTMSIYPNVATSVAASSLSTVYRFRYADYQGYDLNIKWSANMTMPTYVADTCHYMASTADSHVITSFTIARRGTYNITASKLDSWKDRVDADGYLYISFNSKSSGSVTFLTDKPEPSTSPCVLGSTELKLNSVVTLNLASVHTIYRINYAEWQAAGATLAWEGTSPLHTFLAGTCTFPVAPHNRYVLDYEAVLPAGEKVMAADWLARMAQYVDEDGYLYIRFLTEFEGTLKVGQ
jgi:hypothetical protein